MRKILFIPLLLLSMMAMAACVGSDDVTRLLPNNLKNRSNLKIREKAAMNPIRLCPAATAVI